LTELSGMAFSSKIQTKMNLVSYTS